MPGAMPTPTRWRGCPDRVSGSAWACRFTPFCDPDRDKFQYKALAIELPLKPAGYADYSADVRLDRQSPDRLRFRTADRFVFVDAS
jgi:hypothetical protein